MKSILVALVCLVLSTLVSAQSVVTYNVAHTRTRDVNMVVVKVAASFFNADLNTQARWYTDIQSCVRRVNMAGTVIVVASYNGGFRFYGPKTWHDFLRSIDMAWVNARVNKEMTCQF